MTQSVHRDLVLAYVALGAAIALWAACLTILIIAAINPPVVSYGSAEVKAQLAESAQLKLFALPLLGLVMIIVSASPLIMRRPVMASYTQLERLRNISRPEELFARLALPLTAIGLALTFQSSIVVIQASTDRPITDSSTFSSVGIRCLLSAFGCCLLSQTLFLHWWRSHGANEQPTVVTCHPELQ